MRYIILLVPFFLGVAATRTDYLPFKMGVPLLCALIVGYLWSRETAVGGDMLWIVAAFVFSAIGDYFLSNKSGQESYFVIGIGLYFLAHIGYLVFALRNGRPHWVGLGVLLLIFLPYFLFWLRPAIDDTVLRIAVLLYLLISCLALATALGVEFGDGISGGWGRGLFIFGISMILLSDTVISFNEFLQYRELNWVILPTYYLAHLTITAALLWRAGVHSTPVASLSG